MKRSSGYLERNFLQAESITWCGTRGIRNTGRLYGKYTELVGVAYGVLCFSQDFY